MGEIGLVKERPRQCEQAGPQPVGLGAVVLGNQPALAGIDFISQGSVVVRHTTCAKPGCRCQGDPPRRHSPYYQWSRDVADKTVSRRLNEHEAELYRGWIANRRRLEEIVAQMEQTSRATGELLLRQTTPPQPLRPTKR